MTITTYYGEGFADVRELVTSIVKDLTGAGSPISGSAAQHMKVVYPTSYTVGTVPTSNSNVIILEATSSIDPFSPPPAATSSEGYDSWRIALHWHKWKLRSSTYNDGGSWTAAQADTVDVCSLGLYVGTPDTMQANVANPTGNAIIGWRSTAPGKFKLPTYRGYDNVNGPWTYKNTYYGRDLIEPLGNTGAEWTNTFDPTPNDTKFKTAGESQALGLNDEGGPSPKYQSPADWDGPEVTDGNQLFINKWITYAPSKDYGGSFASTPRAQLNSYRLVLSDHGFFLGVWGPDPEEAGSGFSWVVVQRPVDKEDGIVRGLHKSTGLPYDGTQNNPSTGQPYPIGNRPLFCVNSVNGQFWKFQVREHDNPIPSTRKDATKNDRDSGAVINPYQQQSLTENGEYVITFLNNLNTSRFKYSDELDMVGTVSSDVVGGGSEIEVSVYNENEKRTYHALWSSGPFGSKMRIMVVMDVPAPRNPAL